MESVRFLAGAGKKEIVASLFAFIVMDKLASTSPESTVEDVLQPGLSKERKIFLIIFFTTQIIRLINLMSSIHNLAGLFIYFGIQ